MNRKWPELLREKDGTAVPLFFVRLDGGTAVPPDELLGVIRMSFV